MVYPPFQHPTSRSSGIESERDPGEATWEGKDLFGLFGVEEISGLQMGVSKHRGFSPQIIHFNRVFHYFHHPFWGTTIFGNIQICLKWNWHGFFCCWEIGMSRVSELREVWSNLTRNSLNLPKNPWELDLKILQILFFSKSGTVLYPPNFSSLPRPPMIFPPFKPG